MTPGTRAAALGRADALFIAFACGVVPLVSLVIAVQAFAAIEHANLAAYVASIVKWTALGGGALVLGRRGGMSWDELYLDPRGSFLVRRPASACAVVILFIAVVNFGVLHRFTVTWNALGLPHAPVPYLAMPPSVPGRALGVLCALSLASFGVYLGRFMRFNSWDALLHPRRVVDVIRIQLDNPLTEPRLAASLVVLTISLSVGYVVLYSFAGLRSEFDRPSRTFSRP